MVGEGEDGPLETHSVYSLFGSPPGVPTDGTQETEHQSGTKRDVVDIAQTTVRSGPVPTGRGKGFEDESKSLSTV